MRYTEIPDFIERMCEVQDLKLLTSYGKTTVQCTILYMTYIYLLATFCDFKFQYFISTPFSTCTGDWVPWSQKVPQVEIETHKVNATDVVVPTMDTVRHEGLLYTWLAEHRPMLLCGPPGSGKTMTLFSALRCLPDMEVVGLNFSSATTPELMLKTFDQYCEYR